MYDGGLVWRCTYTVAFYQYLSFIWLVGIDLEAEQEYSGIIDIFLQRTALHFQPNNAYNILSHIYVL
jgi:hypothetical protein